MSKALVGFRAALLILVFVTAYADEYTSTHEAPSFSATKSAESLDPRVLGSWKLVSYTIQGVVHPMRGLMIITPNYFMANSIIQSAAGAGIDANANSGPYRVKSGNIVLTQWMQLHYRPSDPKNTLLTEGVVEEISYTLEKDTLVLHFPSGNSYTSERLRVR